MYRFVVRRPRDTSANSSSSVAGSSTSTTDIEEHDITTAAKRPRIATSASKNEKMRQYKQNMKYSPDWKAKWNWILYDQLQDGMFCSYCKKYGKPPVGTHGAWVTRPISNWAKATQLLAKHEKSEWHLASVEAHTLSEMSRKSGDVVEMMIIASEEEKKRNRELMKKLIRSLYFLVRNRIPHTTTFENLITLQIDNGNQELREHKLTCPSNATYLSKVTTAELLSSISNHIEQGLLARLNASQYITIMADESTDVSCNEELCICARWLENGRPVEHFLSILPVHEVNAEALTTYLLKFIRDKCIDIKKVRGLGFDGTNTMSGEKSGVQIRMRRHSPSALYVHCRCHQLQLAAVNAATELSEVNRVMGTLLTMWKTFHYSPKKAEKLVEIQAVLNAPELKMHKPSETRWLARERCVRAVRKSLPALILTFEQIYSENGDAEAYGLAKIMCTYKFVACLYMLCDVLHLVAQLHGSLQSKEVDLASVPVMLDSTVDRLKELKESPASSTWFKDHEAVFLDPQQLGDRNLVVTEAAKQDFLKKVYRPYIQSVIDHISSRLKSSDVFSAFSLFDPRHLPSTEASLSEYGTEKLRTMTNFYGSKQQVTFEGETGMSDPDVDPELTEAEWKIFRRILYSQYKDSSNLDSTTGLQKVTSSLLNDGTLNAGFPNLANLASIALVLPVTTATVERSFSDMKLVKTRLRSRMGEDTLEHAMRVCIEGPDTLCDKDLESIVNHWKEQKTRRISV